MTDTRSKENPEYCGLSRFELQKNSEDGKYHIGSMLLTPQDGKEANRLIVYHKGLIVYTRAKHRLSLTEDNLTPGPKPEVIRLGNELILPLMCYELMFPEDYIKEAYMESEKRTWRAPDVIVHLVGSPMYDENQKEGWVAMHKTLSILYGCPVVCCCGGPEGRMNITGVTTNGV